MPYKPYIAWKNVHSVGLCSQEECTFLRAMYGLYDTLTCCRLQLKVYPHSKREICYFWKSSIADSGNWTQDLSHHRSALILLSYREIVEEVGFISSSIECWCTKGHSLVVASGLQPPASGLQPFIECYWKIACLRHAIFSGTPGTLGQ